MGALSPAATPDLALMQALHNTSIATVLQGPSADKTGKARRSGVRRIDSGVGDGCNERGHCSGASGAWTVASVMSNSDGVYEAA